MSDDSRQAFLLSKILIIMDFIILFTCGRPHHQLPRGGVFDQRGNRLTYFYLLVIDLIFDDLLLLFLQPDESLAAFANEFPFLIFIMDLTEQD